MSDSSHKPECSDHALPDAERTPCEVWTRVMGYHRPVSAFNPGKQSEHAERKHFLEGKADETPNTTTAALELGGVGAPAPPCR